MLYTRGLGIKTTGTAWKVGAGVNLLRSDCLGIKHADIGDPPLGQTPAAL